MHRLIIMALALLFSVSLYGAAKVPYGIEGVRFTREEAIQSKVDRKGQQYSLDGDPSYYRTAKFMSWSRGGYFFYADASSPAALDRFMKAFPFWGPGGG